MAIRKSKEEVFLVQGNLKDWLIKSEQALNKGGFTKIKLNETLNQLTGNYKKIAIWGEISIILIEVEEEIQVTVQSTANTDNIFAVFINPNQKILDQFKNNLN